jgi:EpsI family protein
MLDRKYSFWVVLVPGFLIVQALFVDMLSGHEQLPPLPSSAFPSTIGDWKAAAYTDPVDSASVRELKADRLVNQTYVRAGTGETASLFVAWFQTQQGGRQPHSPKVCLPGSGWIPESTGEIELSTAAGVFRVSRYLVVKGSQRLIALYWYQTPRRAIPGEWASKFWLVADGLRFHRTDTALVRVIAWASAEDDSAASATAADFTQKLFPELRAYLPQ